MQASISNEEFHSRIQSVRDRIRSMPPDAAVWFGATDIHYLVGFDHIQTERPVMLLITPDIVEIVVPRLEKARVVSNDRVDAVYTYFDYPGDDPVGTMTDCLKTAGVESVVCDMDGPPGVWGYEGPPLSEFVEVELQDWVKKTRYRKSDEEIGLLRESSRWANLATQYIQECVDVGVHAVAACEKAELKASLEMLETLGDRYIPVTRQTGPVRAGFISGPQTALPHGHTTNRRLERGDVLITGATANVDGYKIELERTMFVDEPNDEDERYFAHLRNARSVAFDHFKAGKPVSTVAERVWEYFEDNGIEHLAQHHVGHNRGLERHEPPYVDRGSDHIMREGEIYTVEPGIYTENAGYRHSDTIRISEDGHEKLTYFPCDIDSCIIST